MRYPILFLLISSLMVLTGCGVNIAGEIITSTPVFITATLPATAISPFTQTPLPPSPVPTVSPVEGTTTTQVNVRAETSSASENLGTVTQFSKVQITGRDESANWYQIIHIGAPNNTGWIRAEYVQVDIAAEIPVIETAAGNGSGVSGLVIQKINVRSGPGTTFDSLGELNPNDVVFISGKDESGKWMQIKFANSLDGKGWAALELLKVENTEALPVIGQINSTEETAIQTTEPPINPPLQVISDGDSMAAPLARINFSPLGARIARINGSISSPGGDAEDWFEFTSYNGSIAIQIFCSAGSLRIELQSNGEIAENFILGCNEKHLIKTIANRIYLVRLTETDVNNSHQMEYTLTMESIR